MESEKKPLYREDATPEGKRIWGMVNKVADGDGGKTHITRPDLDKLERLARAVTPSMRHHSHTAWSGDRFCLRCSDERERLKALDEIATAVLQWIAYDRERDAKVLVMQAAIQHEIAICSQSHVGGPCSSCSRLHAALKA